MGHISTKNIAGGKKGPEYFEDKWIEILKPVKVFDKLSFRIIKNHEHHTMMHKKFLISHLAVR
jgi:hypothetical protein